MFLAIETNLKKSSAKRSDLTDEEIEELLKLIDDAKKILED